MAVGSLRERIWYMIVQKRKYAYFTAPRGAPLVLLSELPRHVRMWLGELEVQ